MGETGVAVSSLLGELTDAEALHAPEALYLAGDRSLLELGRRVAVVGSRAASAIGVTRTRLLVQGLCELGITVVSGLAEGIDTAAHTEAMERGASTVAVLGTPLDVSYPPSNRSLQAKISAGHLVVSEFRPGTPTHRSHFPRRNRTIALLSDAAIIVEAAERSGTVVVAKECLRLGRRLFLMESLASREDLGWPREMMEAGAEVLTRRNLVAKLTSVRGRSRTG